MTKSEYEWNRVKKCNGLANRTVLVVGAGCGWVDVLCRAYAGAGARVIAMDPHDAPILQSAAADPKRIDPLCLDDTDAVQRRRFCEIWADEPLDVLVHLQPLRAAPDAGPALTSIAALTEALTPALARGAGRLLVLQHAPAAQAPLGQGMLARAIRALPEVLDQPGIRAHAIEIARDGTSDRQGGDLARLALMLTDPAGPPVAAAVIGLDAPGD